jgi:hypothetical protein
MITPEIMLLAAIAVGVGLLVLQARLMTAQLVKLNERANELGELAETGRQVAKFMRLRKPLVAFMKAGTEGFTLPAKIVELTQKHLEELTSLASGAVMAYDLVQADQARRTASPAAGPLPAGSPVTGPVPLPNPPANGGTVSVKQTEAVKVNPGEIHNGKVERVSGRVEMGPPGPALKANADPPRDIALGAPSGADGTG